MAEPRTLPAAVTHYSPRVWVVNLYEFDVKGDPFLCHSDVGNLTWNSKTYIGLGDLVSNNGFNEDGELAATGFNVTFNIWRSELVAAARASTYRNRELVWTLAFVDLASQRIVETDDTPVEVLRGTMKGLSPDAQNGVINVQSQDDRELMHRPMGLTVEPAQWQQRNKGANDQGTDKFWDLLKQMADVTVRVGIK